jgi:DNA-binding NarL/FixJ family response regulator
MANMPKTHPADKNLGLGSQVQRSLTKALRILLLEDDERDAELIEEQLRRTGMKVTLQRVDTEKGFASGLREFAPDVVISDHSLMQFNAKAALKVLRAVRPTAPLIVVSGLIDGQAMVAYLRAGAEDVVLKDHLALLGSVIEAALSVRRRLRKLSPRQLEVLRQVAEGHTTAEIARRLGLSVKTVETHRSELMKRLGLHDVVGLVRSAVRIGLVLAEP